MFYKTFFACKFYEIHLSVEHNLAKVGVYVYPSKERYIRGIPGPVILRSEGARSQSSSNSSFRNARDGYTAS